MSNNYPKNISEKDKKWYNAHFNNKTFVPQVEIFHGAWIFWSKLLFHFQKGFIKSSFPWEQFYSLKHFKGFGLILKSLFLGKIRVIKEPILYLTNEHSNNYFHWCTEVIPKLLIAQRKSPSINALLLPHFCQTRFHIDSLQQLGFKYRVLEKGLMYKCRLLYHVTNQSEYPGYFHKETISHLSHWIKNQKATPSEQSKRDVFISRGKAARRKLSNEIEIQQGLKKRGYEIIFAEDLSFENSLQFFSSVRNLVSIHGAGLTNMIFMPRGSNVIEFLHPDTMINKCYFFLAKSLQHNYYYLNGRVKNKDSHLSHIESDLWVDPKKLFTLLDQLGNQ